MKNALAGDAPLNWREEVPVDDWLGVTVDRSRGPCDGAGSDANGVERTHPQGVRAAWRACLAASGPQPACRQHTARARQPGRSGHAGIGGQPLDWFRTVGTGKLKKLTDLWLQGNRLVAPPPAEVAALPKLVVLRLDDDDTAGEAPAQDRGRSGLLDLNLLCQPLLEALSRLNDDCTTLLDIRDVLTGDVQLNWSDTVPIRYWRGVTVGPTAIAGEVAEGLRVTALDLSHMGLNGRIPPELSALDALAVLRLGHNQLAGSIPPELGALSRLRTLDLENNALTGTIPDEMSALQGLVSLRLGNNELTGRTRQFTTLANLRVLALGNNGLAGNIHPQVGNLSRLEELRLDNNRLSGAIPTDLDRLARLAVLGLGGNALSGCISAASRVAQIRHNDLESADLLCESSPLKPYLFEDGARLMRLRDTLAGDAVLNWSYARPSHSGRAYGSGAPVASSPWTCEI